LIVLENSTCCDILVPSLDGFIQITAVCHEIFQGVLGNFIRGAIGLSGQVLELSFEVGC